MREGENQKIALFAPPPCPKEPRKDMQPRQKIRAPHFHYWGDPQALSASSWLHFILPCLISREAVTVASFFPSSHNSSNKEAEYLGVAIASSFSLSTFMCVFYNLSSSFSQYELSTLLFSWPWSPIQYSTHVSHTSVMK